MRLRLHPYSFFLIAALTLGSSACQSQKADESTWSAHSSGKEVPDASVPDFNAAKAFEHIHQQVAFGPRVPGTAAHRECADYLHGQLQRFCDTVFRQETTVRAGNGKMLPCINLIGVIRPEAKRRLLLLAHWDTRPWADQEDVDSDTPIDGADDGASGVGVLLALAEVFKSQPLPEGLGIDILFADVEDYGRSEWGEDSYALGTQYWVRNTHVAGYTADEGILLDMVGARNARFPLEGYSRQYAPALQRAVWKAAGKAGYSSYFVYENGGAITDDHVPVNEVLKIPTIDIIHLPSGSQTGFGSHWHTQHDNLDIIDQNTLKAVGQTLIQYIYGQP